MHQGNLFILIFILYNVQITVDIKGQQEQSQSTLLNPEMKIIQTKSKLLWVAFDIFDMPLIQKSVR